MFNNVSCTYLVVLCCNNPRPLVLSIERPDADVSLRGSRTLRRKTGLYRSGKSKQSIKNKFQVVRVKSSYASRSGVLSGLSSGSLKFCFIGRKFNNVSRARRILALCFQPQSQIYCTWAWIAWVSLSRVANVARHKLYRIDKDCA